MSNITLPSNPVNGQKVVIGTRLFQYDSTAGRWKSRVFQPLGDTTVTVTNESPTITASLSEIALDTSGANVSFTYTVSDVDSSILKVDYSVSGIANSDLATVTHHRANNTITITAGATDFANGQITLTVTDGRNNATDTVDVSASYGLKIGDAVGGGFYAGIIDTTVGNIIADDDYQTGARYALIVSPKIYEGGRDSSPATGLPTGDLQWSGDVNSVDGFGNSGSYTRWNGLGSTNWILAKNDPQYEVFEYIRALRNTYPVPDDGGSDWYLPAMDELELLYRNLKPRAIDNRIWSESCTFPPGTHENGFNPSSDPTASRYTSGDPIQTSVSAFQFGGNESMDLKIYWSSTDAGFRDGSSLRRAWAQHFVLADTDGIVSAYYKATPQGTIRPVRRILLDN